MLSPNLTIIKRNNISNSKNSFKVVREYTDLCKYKKEFNVSYATYFKDNHGKDRLVYSARIDKSMITTWYDMEMTRICDISNNKIVNDKELISHNNISHNLSLFDIDNQIIGYGGCYSIGRNSNNKKGIFSFNFQDDNISNIKITISKDISKKTNYSTAFDSNICCLKYNNKYYLYTRYNEGVGRRKTQLFVSDKFDSNFKYTNVVKFNDPTVFTYAQNIFVENNIFIGLFRIYRKKKSDGSHDIYNNGSTINYLIAHSFDGLNFILDNEDFIPNYSIHHYMALNYKRNGNKKNFFLTSGAKTELNIIKEYEVRDGGYINYQTEINIKPGEIVMQVLNNKNTILLNYTINEGGYINIFFIDENNNEISKKELFIKDHTNNIIDIPNNCTYISIKFNKSKIYQIL